MTNRISQFRAQATSPRPDIPETCGFCGAINAKSTFIALTTKPPLSAICGACIERLYPLSKLGRLNALYWESDFEWALLHRQLGISMAGKPASDRAKWRVCGLLLRLAKRSAAILAGARSTGTHCPIHEVSLLPRRIALIGIPPHAAFDLVSACAFVLGMPLVTTVPGAMNVAAHELHLKSNKDSFLSEHGIIFVFGIATEAETRDLKCTVICGAEKCEEWQLPAGMKSIDLSPR